MYTASSTNQHFQEEFIQVDISNHVLHTNQIISSTKIGNLWIGLKPNFHHGKKRPFI